MKEILKDFPPQTASVMGVLLECQWMELTIRRQETGYLIENRSAIAYEFDVLLVGASGLPEGEKKWPFEPGHLTKTERGYALTGMLDDAGLSDILDVTLTFECLEASVWAVRADLDMMYQDPWMYLSSMAYGIMQKGACFPELLNQQERALMPLVRELAVLKHWRGEEKPSFPLLKERFPRELIPMLEALENAVAWKEVRRCSDRLEKNLRLSKYVPLWEEFWYEIAPTQIHYPFQTVEDSEILDKITKYLRRHGYEGSYPNYQKRGLAEKSRLISSHGRFFRLRKGTHICSHIGCRVSFVDGDCCVSFAIGTEILTDEDPKGLNFCRFDGNGWQFRNMTNFCFGSDGAQFEERMNLVVKRAELRPLNRAERKLDGEVSSFRVFLWVILLFGGFFAVCMTAGLFLLSLLLAALLQGDTGLVSFLADLPWLQTFFGSWILSGGTLGLLLGIFTKK